VLISESKERWWVLKDREAGSYVPQELDGGGPEPALVCNAAPLAKEARRLARHPARNERRTERPQSGEPAGLNAGEIAEGLGAEVVLVDKGGIGINLGKMGGGEAGPARRERKPADAGEEIEVGEQGKL
jgi:hypothetical protein